MGSVCVVRGPGSVEGQTRPYPQSSHFVASGQEDQEDATRTPVLELDQVTGGQAPSAQGALQSSALSGSAPSFPQDQGRRCVERCFAVCGHLGSGFCGV